MEKNIESFAKILGNYSVEARFAIAAKDRQRAIQRIHWNRKKGQWFDAWLSHDNCSMSETDNRTVSRRKNFYMCTFEKAIHLALAY